MTVKKLNLRKIVDLKFPALPNKELEVYGVGLLLMKK